MTWRWKSPKGFPAIFPEGLRKSVAMLGTPIVLNSGLKEHMLETAAEFRFYRWCLRTRPDHDMALGRMALAYHFRTRIESYPGTFNCHLWLTANVNPMEELAVLNPELADCFPPAPARNFH